MAAGAGLRIGELSRRLGVSPDVLRAWERRYRLLDPDRSPAGHRLYGRDDEARVRRMLDLMADGYGPGTAARLARTPAPAPAPGPGPTGSLDALRLELRSALDVFDDAGAQAALDRLLAAFGLETVLEHAVLAELAALGLRWRRGEAGVAVEHFASALLRSRLRALGRGWDRGVGPLALVACPPGERHDLGLLCFSLALREHGWRITFLGADTPVAALADAAASVEPHLVVVGAVQRDPLAAVAADLRALGAAHPLAVGGAGADRGLAAAIGARHLGGGPLAGAAACAATG